jgi:hypothetical protein
MDFGKFLGNVIDPFHLIYKEPKKKATAYMLKQRKAIKEYRAVYYSIVGSGKMTNTQMKKLGLYSEAALETGVSMMKGGLMPIPEVEGLTPIDPAVDRTEVVLSPEAIEHIEDQTVQLSAMQNDSQTPDNRKKFMARKRRRESVLKRQRLAMQLANILDPGVSGGAVQYMGLSIEQLNDLIETAEGREEKSEFPDGEEKIPEEDRAESSDLLSEVEKKMRQSEAAYPDSKKFQGIKKQGTRSQGLARNSVHWRVLRELIRSSLTESNRNFGTLLMLTGSSLKNRTASVLTVLDQIGDMEGAAQRMLDLLASFGINLRPSNSKFTAEQAVAYLPELLDQFVNMDESKKRKLRVSFNKLFRVLIEERLQNPTKRGEFEKINKTLRLFLTDLAQGVTVGNQEGDLVSPEKIRNVGDFINIENEKMLEVFQQLLAASGNSDDDINGIFRQLTSLTQDRVVLEYDRIIDESKEAGSDVPESEARLDAEAKAYAGMVQKILTYIQSLNNTLEARFVKDSSLRNALNIGKLRRTIQLMIEEVRIGMSQAVIKFPSVNTDNILSNFQKLIASLGRLNRVASSLTTRTSAGGQSVGESESSPSSSSENNSLLSIEMLERKYAVSPEDNTTARRTLNELSRPGVDLVSINIRGSDFAIGTTAVVIDWSGIPNNIIVRELIQYNNRASNSSSTPGGQFLQDAFARQVLSSNTEELYRLADTTIQDKGARRDILRRYPKSKPSGGSPEDPDDPGGGRGLSIGINGNFRTLKISAIVALLILLGVSVSQIVRLIENAKKGQSGNARGKIPDKEKPIDDGGNYPPENFPSDNIDNSENNLENNPMNPTFPMPDSKNENSKDPIYGGIGTIAPRSVPFKPIGQPTLDVNLGADYLEPDDNMMKNSAIMKMVEKYNDDASRFNELLELKYDLEASGSSLTDDELNELSALGENMKNQIQGINQQAPLVPSILYSEGRYYGSEIPVKTMPYAFKSIDGTSINKTYTLIPMDEFSKSVGLNDDIETYNSLAEQYNLLALQYRNYGQDFNVIGETGAANKMREDYVRKKSEDTAYASALKRATDIESKITPLLAKINSVMSNPSTSVGRDRSRAVAYNDLEKSLIGKAADLNWTGISTITEEEKEAMRDNPELYPDFEKMMSIYNRMTQNGKNPINRRSTEDPQWQELVDLRQKFITVSSRGFTASGSKAPLQQADFQRVQQLSQKEYMRSKKDFLDAVARLKSATARGASSHEVSQLYNDLETKRMYYDKSRESYERMADNYKHALSGRTSYLGDMTLEKLPETDSQIEKFDRLQTIERILQNNPDAVKEYNDKVKGMSTGFGSTIEQSYEDRMNLLKVLATKHNLTTEYTEALNKDIEIHVNDIAEDPSTIVNFEGEGAENVGKSSERANFIDPAERSLFMLDERDRILEQKRFEDFSFVQPWNGLGNPRTNPLLDHQVQEYMLRYDKTTKGAMPTMGQMRNLQRNRCEIIRNREQQPNPKTDFPFIPTIQASFGREIFEDVQANPTNNYKTQRAVFTREDNDLPNNMWKTWYPIEGSTYHPDRQIDMHNYCPSSTANLRTNSSRRAVFEGLPAGLNQQYGSQQTSTLGGATMNNNYGQMPNMITGRQIEPPQIRPNSIFDNLDTSAKRMMCYK